MIKKFFTLFKLGRKIAKSDILSIASKFKKPPVVIKILFKLLSISFSKKNQQILNTNEGERLSNSLESMGTTFIKLGQFLATRPDIIGEEMANALISEIERATGQAIDSAVESELAAAINEAVAYAIQQGVSAAAAEAAIAAMIWVYSNGGSDEDAMEACRAHAGDAC